jgi:arginyl-tRNA synthetase
MASDKKKTDGGIASARSVVIETIAGALEKLGLKAVRDMILLERPNDPDHGDLSCNIALATARELASEIASLLSFDPDFIDKVEVADPGFINFTFSRSYLTAQIAEINRLGGSYGDSNLGKGEKLQVEFVSANPTGPLVIVSARAAAVGNALANILQKVGYDVEAEYYINDTGAQVAKLGKSLLVRFKQLLGDDVPFPEDGYPGKYLLDIAERIPTGNGRRWLEMPEEEAISAFGNFAIESIIHIIKNDLMGFGVYFDVFFRESELYGRGGEVDEALALL